jgi:hypothetical protein
MELQEVRRYLLAFEGMSTVRTVKLDLPHNRFRSSNSSFSEDSGESAEVLISLDIVDWSLQWSNWEVSQEMIDYAPSCIRRYNG